MTENKLVENKLSIEQDLDTYEGLPSVADLGEEIFDWTKKKMQAAYLIALGKYSYTDIARVLKINYHTLSGWRRSKTFTAKVSEFVLKLGLSDRVKRVQGAKRIVEKLELGILDKLDDRVEMKKVRVTPLIARYLDGIKLIQKETEQDNMGHSKNKKEFNLIDKVNEIQDVNKREELKSLLRDMVISAIQQKRGTTPIIEVKDITDAETKTVGTKEEDEEEIIVVEEK